MIQTVHPPINLQKPKYMNSSKILQLSKNRKQKLIRRLKKQQISRQQHKKQKGSKKQKLNKIELMPKQPKKQLMKLLQLKP